MKFAKVNGANQKNLAIAGETATFLEKKTGRRESYRGKGNSSEGKKRLRETKRGGGEHPPVWWARIPLGGGVGGGKTG